MNIGRNGGKTNGNVCSRTIMVKIVWWYVNNGLGGR